MKAKTFEVSPRLEAGPPGGRSHVIFDNLLIRRDLRRLRRSWFRSPGYWALAAIALANFAAQALWASVRVFLNPDDFDEGLQWYFVAFHLYLQVALPIMAWRMTRAPATQTIIEETRLSPIPERHVFWWLWSRMFTLGLAPVLIAYFSLYMAYPWLTGYEAGESDELFDFDLWAQSSLSFWELMCDFFLIALLIMPWLSSRFARRALWTLAVVALYAGWLTLMRAPDFFEALVTFGDRLALPIIDNEVMPGDTLARFHPAVTLRYFLITAAWSAAVGVAVGLHSRPGGRLPPLMLVLLLGPLSEALVYVLSAIDISDLGTEVVSVLYLMLLFYSGSIGLLWMGIKWSLLFHVSRRPLPRD